MLNKLDINNFQSHDKTSLKFHRGVNGIIGKSLSGKTAIIRALKWLMANRPSGFKFHSNFDKPKGTTAVSVVAKGLTKITLTKQGGTGVYEVDNLENSQKPLRFDKIGKNVPDVVSSQLNLTDLNVQEQFDSPFLVLSSAGEIAKTINRITQIDDIDKWIKEINRRTNRAKGKKAIIAEDVEEIKDALECFEGLDKAKAKIDQHKAVKKKLDRLQAELDRLDNLVDTIRVLRSTIDSFSGYRKAKRNVEQIIALQEVFALLTNEKNLIQSLLQTQTEIAEAEKERTKLIALYTKELEKQKKCPTCFRTIRRNDIKGVANAINSTVRRSRNH